MRKRNIGNTPAGVLHISRCNSVWLECLLWEQDAAGSSPVTSTIDSRIYKIRFVSHLLKENHRGVAQVVAHQTGGLGVASSSLVTPTKSRLKTCFFILKCAICKDFGSLLSFVSKAKHLCAAHLLHTFLSCSN